MLKRTYFQVSIHILVWLCFISFPFLMFQKPPENFDKQIDLYFQINYIISNLLFIGFYYLNSLVLIPKLLARHKITKYVISIIILFVIIVILPELLKPEYEFKHFEGHKPPHKHIFNTFTALMFLIIFMISSGIKIINTWFETEKYRTLIEKEKLQTELTNLKAQINPHFLFNVLNTIYALALKKSDSTPETIMQLSKLLRYIVNETQADKVPLEKEIDCISNYIDLQKMRLSETVELTFNKKGDFNSAQIAPLLLITFVENVFKHGISTHKNSPISIDVFLDKNMFTLKTKNNIFTHINKETTGIGLENVKKRLKLIYEENHILNIKETDNVYEVELIINLV